MRGKKLGDGIFVFMEGYKVKFTNIPSFIGRNHGDIF